MKKLFFYLLVAVIATSCSNSGNGELIGVQDRPAFYQAAPYGMVFVPLGSFTMGASDQDVPYAHVHEPKTVSIQSFYMDETEITNNEYRQFVNWVRDSIAREIMGGIEPTEFLIEEDGYGDPLSPPYLNWEADLDWKSEDAAIRGALDAMYYEKNDRFYGRKQIDTRRLDYTYYWIDLRRAARKEYATNPIASDVNYPSNKGGFANRPTGFNNRNSNDPTITSRKSFIVDETVNIYPDTLCWIHDFTYSYNDPMTRNYFWHPTYDNYPVVGVNWKQAKAFSYWRTALMNTWLEKNGEVAVNEFRLPSEAEWEWGARGGWEMNPYPWGGPYLRNAEGCFLANFKPGRGNYVADGGIQTVIVAHYSANDWGLYDMSGNVSEWTISAYDESSFNFTWDMNPNYEYNAKETEAPQMKKKVIRGGSWKDVGYFLQVTARQFEYQDTAKAYVGFRCMQTYLGRMANDNTGSSKIYK